MNYVKHLSLAVLVLSASVAFAANDGYWETTKAFVKKHYDSAVKAPAWKKAAVVAVGASAYCGAYNYIPAVKKAQDKSMSAVKGYANDLYEPKEDSNARRNAGITIGVATLAYLEYAYRLDQKFLKLIGFGGDAPAK